MGLTILCFIGFAMISGSEMAAGTAAFIFSVALLISPLTKNLVRGLFSPWRRQDEGWDNYFRE
jgi:hypothetical protein